MKADHILVHDIEHLALKHLASSQHGFDRDHRDVLRREHAVDRCASVQAHASAARRFRKECRDEIAWHAKGIWNAFGGRLFQTSHGCCPSFSGVYGSRHTLRLNLECGNHNFLQFARNENQVLRQELFGVRA